MSVSHTKSCNVAAEYIELTSQFLARFGINQYFYGITPKMTPPSHPMFKKLRHRLPNEMIKANYVISSSQSIIDYRHRYLQHFAAYDEAFFEKQQSGLNILQNPDPSSLKGLQLWRLMGEYNINSKGTWRLPVKYHPDWHSVFMFFSDLEPQILKQNLQEAQTEIEHQLLLYSKLFNDQHISLLNPITNFNCLTSKSLQVLKLTAEGLSSDEVAFKLALTESGVNYHLNRLKELFNATNRAQLVNQGHLLGLL